MCRRKLWILANKKIIESSQQSSSLLFQELHLIRPSSHICSAVDAAAAWLVCGGVVQTVVRLRSWLHARLQQLLASSGHLDLGCRQHPGHAILAPALLHLLACNLHTVQYTLYRLYCSTLYTGPVYGNTASTVRFTPNMADCIHSVHVVIWRHSTKPSTLSKVERRAGVKVSGVVLDWKGLGRGVGG